MNTTETAELFRTMMQWQKSASAVVVRTWRTAPRPVGSRLIIRDDAVFAGSVSGGCVEKEVILAAQNCIQNRKTNLLSFGVSDDTAWQSGLSCGGQIEIFVAPYAADDAQSQHAIDDFLQATNTRQSGALITQLHDGHMRFIRMSDNACPPCGVVNTLPQNLSAIFNQSESNINNTDSESPNYFVEWCAPSMQLLIIGAVHIAQALAPIATSCGFAVTIIDPRSGFAHPQRFANTTVLTEWPDEVFANSTLSLDSHTAVVTLSHDPKIDDPALIAALHANVAYIGALGSTRTHDRRKQRLQENGFADSDINRIHAPVGLDIGAQTATEIAVSIMSEIISVCTAPANAQVKK